MMEKSLTIDELLNFFSSEQLRKISSYTDKVWNTGMLYGSGSGANQENIERIDQLNGELMRYMYDFIKESNLDLLKRLEEDMELSNYNIGVPSENLNSQEDGESIVAEMVLDAITRERERIEKGE